MKPLHQASSLREKTLSYSSVDLFDPVKIVYIHTCKVAGSASLGHVSSPKLPTPKKSYIINMVPKTGRRQSL